MKYYLRKKPFEYTIEEIVKTNGEIIPKRELISDDRALYQAMGVSTRRYRDGYPIPHAKELKLYTCKSLSHIIEERQNLFDYCGEWFDVYDDNGKVNIETSWRTAWESPLV